MEQQYKLFAGVPQNTHGSPYSYYGTGRRYMLIFATEKPEKGLWAEVPKANYADLKEDEKIWLMRCKQAVLKKHFAENEADFVPEINKFLDELEKACVEEKERLNEQNTETK